MLIKVKKILYGETAIKEYPWEQKEDDVKETKIEDVVYCCKDMKEFFNQGYWIEPTSDDTLWLNIEGLPSSFMDIRFCPWCGERIKVKIVKVVKLKKRVKEITEKRIEYIEEEVS